MVASHFSTLGFLIEYSPPLWSSDATRPVDLSEQIENWEHEISADGGYYSASCALSGGRVDYNDWLENGLGRHIEIYGYAKQKFGEYFVNEIEVTIGGLTIRRGPLLGVCNRVAVSYTPVLDDCEDTAGTETMTTFTQDLDSQSLYAIQEELISGGTLNDDTTSTLECGGAVLDNEAEQIRDLYLEERKYPETTQDLALGKTEVPRVTINLRGYSAFFDRYLYYETDTISQTVSDKIKAVIGADAGINAIFSADLSQISTNMLLVSKEDIDYRSARAVIDSLMSLGDVGNNRTIFGVYNDRIAKYNTIGTGVSYYYRITEGKSFIETEDQRIISPWNVLPGRWMFFPDFMIGKASSDTPDRNDPRFLFIESVHYSTIYDLSINGGKVNRFDQLMAKRNV